MKSFDERARDWDTDPAKVERARRVADAIAPHMPPHPGLRAMEYGCGTGLLSFALREHFPPERLSSITLADTSAGMLEVLADKIAASGEPGMRPQRLDLLADPTPPERYDVIYSLMTLHHLPDTDRALAAFEALLEPGGWLFLADLDREDGSFHGQEVHGVHHGFERDVLGAALGKRGFTDITFSTALEIERPTAEGTRRFPVFLASARKPPAA